MNYCNILGEPLPIPESFHQDGREGSRIGYHCPACGECFPIHTDKLRWDHSGVASDGQCPCGASVVGIYETPYATPRARGKRKERGVMNSTEKRFFAEVIRPRIDAGKVIQCWYERWTWVLTNKTPGGKPGIRYTPDFVCLLDSGELIVFEVKGQGNARRQDLNRVKVFADNYPLRVYVATLQRVKDGGGFKIEEY